MSNPIADLSYRNYDGPLTSTQARWWSIARQSINSGIKKKFFVTLSLLSASFYFVLLIVFYFVEVLNPPQTPGDKNLLLSMIKWNEQFLNAFSTAQLWLLLLALLLGSGSIANDNRANALLVYLSKPCTKLDYLIGKWLGIFIPLAVVTAIPTFMFYFYCLMSYREYGFITQDPWMFVKLIFMVLLPAGFHASVSMGISSLFNQGRIAGAVYAAVYFMTLFFTKFMQVAWIFSIRRGGSESTGSQFVANLYYMSVDGLQIGLAKHILGTRGGLMFPGQGMGGQLRPRTGRGLGGANAPPQMNAADMIPTYGSLWLLTACYLGCCALALYVAWRRVRAVEVIGG